jgi:hypothetical protein
MAARTVSSPSTFDKEPFVRSQRRQDSPPEDTSADLWRNPSGKRSRSRRVGHLLRGRPKSSLGCCSDNTGGINHSSAFWHSVGHAQERSAGCIWSQWICWHRVRSGCAIARLVPKFMISTLINVLVLKLDISSSRGMSRLSHAAVCLIPLHIIRSSKIPRVGYMLLVSSTPQKQLKPST